MKKLFVCLAILVLINVPVFAQQITCNYDKFQNITTCESSKNVWHPDPRPYIIRSYRYEPMEAYAYFFTDNTSKNGLSDYRIVIWSNTENWRYLGANNHSLTVIADGEKFDFGETYYDGNIIGSGVSERMLVKVKSDIFLKIANAKLVEFQLGVDEMQFTSEQLASFRELISKWNSMVKKGEPSSVSDSSETPNTQFYNLSKQPKVQTLLQEFNRK